MASKASAKSASQSSTALSGQNAALEAIDVQLFAKAFVAGLVSKQVNTVHPHSVEDRRGFARVVEALNAEVAKLVKQGLPNEQLLPLLRVVNELRPNSSGSFSRFEAALRSLQMTFTSSPNAFHDDIVFPVSETDARSYFDALPASVQALASCAATAFEAERDAETMGNGNVAIEDADTDLLAYQQALNAASGELTRITDYMRSVNHNALLISASLRSRRAYLCKTVEVLSELIKNLGTH